MERDNFYYDYEIQLSSTMSSQEKISCFFDCAISSIKNIISTYENKSYCKDDSDEDIRYQMREYYLPLEIYYDMIAMLYVVTNTVMDSFSSMKGNILEKYDLNEDDIKPRIDFYDKISKKYIKVRGESLLFDIPTEINDNPVLCCAISFCDILKNSRLIEDYENAPINLEGFNVNIEFVNEVVILIMETVAKYATRVIKVVPTNNNLNSRYRNSSKSQKNNGIYDMEDDTLASILRVVSIPIVILIVVALGIAIYMTNV